MRFRIILLLAVFFLAQNITAQKTIFGSWKTIDDNTGEARSIVEIYKEGDKVFGKIKRILDEKDRDKTCIYCQGKDKDKPIEGLVIIKSLEKDGDEYEGGSITDPENGKTYRCKIWLDEDNPDLLNVRGYIAFLFRTQKWVRV